MVLHNEGKGAKYTRGRGPVKAIGASAPLEYGRALSLESAVKKKRTREAKLETLSSKTD